MTFSTQSYNYIQSIQQLAKMSRGAIPMKVTNMTSNKGNTIANQFIITGEENGNAVEIFQSYQSVIVKKIYADTGLVTYLDSNTWDYSVTTGKYRNQFLGEGIAETRKKIESGEYQLAELN